MLDVPYKQIVVKLSGSIINISDKPSAYLEQLILDLKLLLKYKVKIAIVIGGGNIIRGRNFKNSFNRSSMDIAGMLATVINGLVFQQNCLSHGVSTDLVSALPISGFVSDFNYNNPQLSSNSILICTGGTGRTFVSTDTASAWLCQYFLPDCLIKLTDVDGIYNSNNKLDITTLDYIINNNLEVFDAEACVRMRNLKTKIYFSSYKITHPLSHFVLQNKNLGTLIS